MRVDRPGTGSGASEDAPHGRPELGAMSTDMKKAAALAACPPVLRAVKPVSLMCSDGQIMRRNLESCQRLSRAVVGVRLLAVHRGASVGAIRSERMCAGSHGS